jgi:hypothetical protein
MNSGATLAKRTANEKQGTTLEIWLLHGKAFYVERDVPRARGDPSQTRLGPMGGHIDEPRIVQVQQFGHLQFFFPVRIRAICMATKENGLGTVERMKWRS